MADKFEKQLKKAMNDVAKKLTDALNEVARSHAGRPMSEVEPAVKRAFKKGGVEKPTRDQVQPVAEAISNNKPMPKIRLG